ncbi:helix-turn-helix domain-containing protein [Thiohalorhabdus methylotrophus]|uniref:Helix-turn-helix domain-containing protein n=1 Tax=Thiohalorhabdus methylotrophus TaxID=3242694 RepID=A0ABV4TTE7_9GAMM
MGRNDEQSGSRKGALRENQAETVREPREDSDRLDELIGHTLRERRTALSLTLSELSESSGVSNAMLSRIETGQVSPSLSTLVRITRVLGLSLSELFLDYESPEGGALHVEAGQGLEVVRTGTSRGHTYHLLSYERGPKQSFEAFLVSMDDESEVFPRFKHPGVEFLYMIRGEMQYRHGQNLYHVKPGDALTFDGTVMHGPETLLRIPIRFISIIEYASGEEAE